MPGYYLCHGMNNGFPLRLYPIYSNNYFEQKYLIVYLFDKSISHIYISDTTPLRMYLCANNAILLVTSENWTIFFFYWQKFDNILSVKGYVYGHLV